MPAHVRSGDTVIVTAGSDKGRTGTVLKVIPKKSQVVVQGLNTRTKHLKPSQTNPQGGVITKEMPIHISNVSPVVDGRATRVRFAVKPDGSKVRVAARGGQEIGAVHGPRNGAVAKPARAAQSKKTTKKKTTKKKVAGKSAKKAPAKPAKKASTRTSKKKTAKK